MFRWGAENIKPKLSLESESEWTILSPNEVLRCKIAHTQVWVSNDTTLWRETKLGFERLGIIIEGADKTKTTTVAITSPLQFKSFLLGIAMNINHELRNFKYLRPLWRFQETEMKNSTCLDGVVFVEGDMCIVGSGPNSLWMFWLSKTVQIP